MKASQMLISTLKEAPAEAKIESHKLLLRAGFIKNEVAGVYNYLPLGLKVLNKIENIIRSEMDKVSLEILCSAIQPKELWEESGRWAKYGPELFRFKDRHEREFCLGPTHEEVFTSIARDLIKSPKQLPINLYQIQTKYRDEARPRFGLMRSREFIMKDAYSFDKDVEGLNKSYQTMFDTYSRIFTRLNLNFKPVLADTGAIGGDGSHQFMALCDYGESDIVYCDECGYAADVEKADAICQDEDLSLCEAIEKIYTPDTRTIEEVSKFLDVEPSKLVKSVLYKDTETKKLYLCLVRGDREVNEIKLVNAIHSAEAFLTLANDEDLKNCGTVHGFMGPVGIKNCEVLLDTEVSKMKNLVVGANELNYHLKNVNFDRDFKGRVIDLRKTVEGDLCPCCKKPLKMRRGIEVGQIFKLQTKYSEPMKLTYTDSDGVNKPMVMGCYGIGVTRTMTAIIEQNHDEAGMIWPLNITPYHAVICPVSLKDQSQIDLANKCYDMLNGLDVIYDDRDAGLGFKMKDWELIGLPFIIVCGKKASEGIVELKIRKDLTKQEMTFEEACNFIKESYKNII